MLGFLALWSAVSTAVILLKLFNPIFLPGPWVVADALVTLAVKGQLWGHIAATLERVAIGFSTGAVLAIGIGLPTGYFRVIRNVVEHRYVSDHIEKALRRVEVFEDVGDHSVRRQAILRRFSSEIVEHRLGSIHCGQLHPAFEPRGRGQTVACAKLQHLERMRICSGAFDGGCHQCAVCVRYRSVLQMRSAVYVSVLVESPVRLDVGAQRRLPLVAVHDRS